MPLTKEFLESLKRRRDQREEVHKLALSQAVGRTGSMRRAFAKDIRKEKDKINC